jgi:polyisoprenoid-binding protein YceI
MKKIILVTMVFALCTVTVQAQTIYMTRTGQISFFSKTPMENIEGVNNEVTSMLNPTTGEVVFAVLVKSFRFEKALMEEHFNENYMESDKLPKSSFQGKISNLKDVDFTKDGTYKAAIEGELTIHGVKQPVKTTGTFVVSKNKITGTSAFTVKPSDYNISIPSLVAEKIAKDIEVKVNCEYAPKS